MPNTKEQVTKQIDRDILAIKNIRNSIAVSGGGQNLKKFKRA